MAVIGSIVSEELDSTCGTSGFQGALGATHVGFALEFHSHTALSGSIAYERTPLRTRHLGACDRDTGPTPVSTGIGLTAPALIALVVSPCRIPLLGRVSSSQKVGLTRASMLRKTLLED